MGCDSSKQSQGTRRINGLKTSNGNSKSTIRAIQKMFLGDAGVGKSSIANQYFNQLFKDSYEVTIGGVYFRKDITLKNGQQISIHLWDTGGEERYRAMAPLYYRDASIAILVYDVSDNKSFQSMDYWLKELEEKREKEGMILVVVGNKCDLPNRVVSQEIAEKWAKSKQLQYFETSAKNNIGVKDLFERLAEEYAKRKGL